MQHKHKLSKASPEKQAHSDKLKNKIIASIKKNGTMRFHDYMQACLYDDEFGYYKSGLKKFGADGDFITAPEISELFSFCMAKQFIHLKQQIPIADILEFGAGSGKMAVDILRYLQQHNALPNKYYILELSAELQQRQQQHINKVLPELIDKIVWLDKLPERNSLNALVVANEILDAMPIDLFKLKKGKVFEGFVAIDNDNFIYDWQPANDELTNKVKQLNITTDNYISEINPMVSPWLKAIADCLHQGLILLIDYGYEQDSFYHPQRSMGTLMCHFEHNAHDDPLIYPGIQDITAHVDFTAVAEAADAANLDVINYMTQSFFLMQHRITEMVDPNDQDKYFKQAQQLKQLMLPSEMGEKFKVILLGKNIDVDAVYNLHLQNQLERL